MTRNWYELSIPELAAKKERMLNWTFVADNKDPNQKKMWLALIEVSDVLTTKKEAENDPLLKLAIETLC